MASRGMTWQQIALAGEIKRLDAMKQRILRDASEVAIRVGMNLGEPAVGNSIANEILKMKI